MPAVVVLVAAVLGLGAGVGVDRIAGRWTAAGQPPPRFCPKKRGLGVVVVGGTAVLFGLVALRFGLVGELPAYLFLAAVGVLLTVLDLAHHLLPNRIVLPSVGVAAVLLAGAAALDGTWSWLLRAVLAAAALFAGYLALALVSPGGLGMGDVKLAALLGLYLGWLGWPTVLIGTLAGFVVQAVIALVALATRRAGLQSDIPFGPAMLLGAAIAIGWVAPLT